MHAVLSGDASKFVRIASEDRMRTHEPGDEWLDFVGRIIASTRITVTTGPILLFEVVRAMLANRSSGSMYRKTFAR